MKTRNKSKPEHDALILDEDADPIDRAEAIYCLGLDERFEHEAAIEGLLDHEDGDIRARSLHVMMLWGRTNHLPRALQTALRDPSARVRRTIVHALAQYVSHEPTALDAVCRTYVHILRTDRDCQHSAYWMACELLGAPLDPNVRRHNFDPARDVDWELLAPYAEPLLGPH